MTYIYICLQHIFGSLWWYLYLYTYSFIHTVATLNYEQLHWNKHIFSTSFVYQCLWPWSSWAWMMNHSRSWTFNVAVWMPCGVLEREVHDEWDHPGGREMICVYKTNYIHIIIKMNAWCGSIFLYFLLYLHMYTILLSVVLYSILMHWQLQDQHVSDKTRQRETPQTFFWPPATVNTKGLGDREPVRSVWKHMHCFKSCMDSLWFTSFVS